MKRDKTIWIFKERTGVLSVFTNLSLLIRTRGFEKQESSIRKRLSEGYKKIVMRSGQINMEFWLIPVNEWNSEEPTISETAIVYI